MPGSGELRYREVGASPVRDANGTIIGSISVVRDITDRKHAEKALRESEERYRNLFNTMNEGFCIIEMIFDAEGKPADYRFLEVNAAFENQTGLYDAEGKLMRDLAPDHEAHWFEIYGKIALTGEPLHFTSEARALNRWYDVYAYRVGKPEDRQVAIVFNDITDQKQVEQALKRAHDSLEFRVQERTAELMQKEEMLRTVSVYNRSLLESSLDPLVTIDRQGKISDVNTATELITGYPRGTLIGTDFADYFTNPEKARAGYQLVFKEGQVYDYELEISHRDGHVTPVLYNASVYKDASGEVAGVFAAARNITEQRRLEEQLRQSHKMEALGTLVGGIAHDFNNLLGAVIGFTELIQDDLPPGNPGHGHAARVMEAGMRGRDLVKQMLTFSRKVEQDKQPLRLSSIVKESAKLLRASIPTTISININVVSESGLILADPVQIQQVVMNLCTNAYYAMRDKGGILDIELSDFSVGPSDGKSPGIEPGLYMRLTVRDTGIGIPGQIQERIFDPFFTTKAVGEGTGLGLSVVMGIVKQSGGYITVESEFGKGSTFSVYFPMITGALAADIKGREELLPTGTERILFIDDEEALLEMGKQILTRLGYKVISQMSSEVALTLIEENPSHFDLVITDQTMPEMTGLELAKRILAIRPDMPVILCTGFSHLVDADSARASGIKGFVMKPLTKAEIAKTVRKVLDGKNPV